MSKKHSAFKLVTNSFIKKQCIGRLNVFFGKVQYPRCKAM